MLNYIIILVVLFISELAYLKIAKANGIIDKPNHRSAHINPTIRGGGIIYLPALLLFLIFFREDVQQYYYLIIAVFLVAVISFIDDINPLSTRIRIAVHFIAFSLMFYSFGFFSALTLVSGFLLLLAYAFSLGFLNIYNFMDGINGMTFLNALATFVGM